MMKLNFKRIKIEDKKIFDTYFLENYVNISEYTFTNLFVWDESRIIEYDVYDNILIIKAEYNNEKYFLPPVGIKDIYIYYKLLEYGEKIGVKSIRRIDEETLKKIENNGNFIMIEDRDNFDYVYSCNDLVELKGRKYKNKREFVKKFCDTYDYEYQNFLDFYREDCIKLAEKWYEEKDQKDSTLKNELFAIKRLINHFQLLNVRGGIILIEGRLSAFAFGEKLNANTFVIHFEKADTNFVGIYQTINKFFIQKECYNKFDFINREQDLGIDGIRKAKESYNPVKMIKKYNLALK